MAFEFPKILIRGRAVILGNDKILLIKRSQKNKYMPNKWELPGGKLSDTAGYYENLKREIKEETGLEVKILTKLASIDSGLLEADSGNPLFDNAPFITITSIAKVKDIGENNTSEVVLSDEHSDYKWLSYDEALDLDIKPRHRNDLKSLKTTLQSLIRQNNN